MKARGVGAIVAVLATPVVLTSCGSVEGGESCESSVEAYGEDLASELERLSITADGQVVCDDTVGAPAYLVATIQRPLKKLKSTVVAQGWSLLEESEDFAAYERSARGEVFTLYLTAFSDGSVDIEIDAPSD